MTASLRIRDGLQDFIPWWMKDRASKNVAYRFIWNAAATLDAGMDYVLAGVQAAWPGMGTPTALPYIGRTRRIVRGKADTDSEYEARLRAWLETHAAGRTLMIAKQVQNYVGTLPRVRIIERGPYGPSARPWLQLASDGTVTRFTAAWDWDSVSHPERANYWSEMWILIDPTPYAVRPGTLGGLTVDGYGLGQMVPQEDASIIRGLLADWKGAHSYIRAVIWTSDSAKFNPADSATMPNGNWGAWGTTGSGSRVRSDRDLTTCRYWEPS